MSSQIETVPNRPDAVRDGIKVAVPTDPQLEVGVRDGYEFDPSGSAFGEPLMAGSVAGPDPDACWAWNGTRYAQTGLPCIVVGQEVWSARIAAWVYRNGPLPEGYIARHVCKNTDCLNPRHMAATPTRQKAGGL